MERHYRKTVLMVVLFSTLASCVSMPPLPPSLLRLDQIDTAAVRGKVIVIDPGHGGRYQGALGVRGLKESEVNLGVALSLWGFLYSAGALPILTRTADTTVAPPSHRELRDDLRARSMLSNELNPDLFISIHHNSNTHDLKKNTLEVYYKLGDPGPSRELAECIMKRIKENLVVEGARALPGNYSVLRETTSTAILGEASYLTHRENERRLCLHGFLRQEAEAYFLGILDYFRRGVPRILALTPDGDLLCQAQPEVVGWVQDDAGREGIDPDSIALYVDGGVVEHRYDASTGRVYYIPEKPLTNRPHTLRLEARNLRGNSAKPVCTTFYVSLPPSQIEMDSVSKTLPPDGFSRTRIVAEVVDEHHNGVADGTLVSFTTSAGKLVDALVATSQGKAVTHLISGYQVGWAEVVAECQGVVDSAKVAFDVPEEKGVEIYVHNQHGNPIEGAELVFEDGRHHATDRLGYVFYQWKGSKELEFTVWRDGYCPLKDFVSAGEGEVAREILGLNPIDHALMWNKVVVIDPQSEREPPAADSILEKKKVSRDNLSTALCLKEMLELSGAKVFLTRGVGSSTDLERVMRANEVRADLLLSIDHERGSPSLGYYYLSSRGKLLARSLEQVLVDVLSCRKLKMMESTAFVVVHTSMPAVVINLDHHGCRGLPQGEEERAWREAQALYQGLRSYFKGAPQPR